MLKPQKSYPNPEFLGNWDELRVGIGKFADGKVEWKDVMGKASLKLKK